MAPDAVRQTIDNLKADNPDAVIRIAAVNDVARNLVWLRAARSADAVAAGANAGKIVGAAAQLTGGKGGGRPDSAMAGVKDLSKLSDALAALSEIVGGLLK